MQIQTPCDEFVSGVVFVLVKMKIKISLEIKFYDIFILNKKKHPFHKTIVNFLLKKNNIKSPPPSFVKSLIKCYTKLRI